VVFLLISSVKLKEASEDVNVSYENSVANHRFAMLDGFHISPGKSHKPFLEV